MDPQQQCQHFLRTLYGDLPEGMWFHLWAPDKRTRWFRSADEAAAWALAEAERQDVYCGVALAEHPIGEVLNPGGSPVETQRRITIKASAAVVGMIADLDFASEEHPDRPPDEAAALEWLAGCVLRPTAIVRSGHGLHVWWLHKEPWVFGSDEERAHAIALRRGWHNALLLKLDEHGWGADSVHDLSRVLRVAGTANHKQPPPVPVKLLDLDDAARYEPEDFEEFALGDEYVPKRVLSKPPALPRERPTRGWKWEDVAPLLKLNEPFPHGLHEALCANSPEYKATWDHKRTDMTNRSLSQWDLALANFVAVAGWSPSEIGALLRDHRTRHGDPKEKGGRADYLARTIATALNGVEDDEVDSELQRFSQDPPERKDVDERAKAIAMIGKKLDIGLENIQRVSGTPPVYLFWAEGKCAPLKAEQVVQQSTVQGALFTICGRLPRSVDKTEKPSWRDLVNLIAKVAEELDAGEDATFLGELGGLLNHVVEVMGGMRRQESGAPVEEPHRPFIRDGRTWFRTAGLMNHLPAIGLRLTQRELCQRLKAMGAVYTSHHCKPPGAKGADGKTECLKFWGIAAVKQADVVDALPTGSGADQAAMLEGR